MAKKYSELRIKRILYGLSTRDVSILTGISMAQIRKVETLSDELISKRGLCGTKKRLETVYSHIYETMSVSDKKDFDAAVVVLGKDFRKYIDPLLSIFDDGSCDSDDDLD